jgi:glyoxylase-like metal-dependent hydrolase (beta-lactamase superfamily II)
MDPFLVDCGPANMFARLRRLLQQIPATKILITHHHEDHTGNLAPLLAGKEMEVYAHPQAEGLLQDVHREIPFYRRLIWGRPQPARMNPIPEFVETPQYGFRVLHTPGHSQDHVCLFEPDRRWLFTGDLYLASYLRYLREDENIHQIMKSLRILIDLNPKMIFCGHRGFITDAQNQLSKKLGFLETLSEEVSRFREKGIPEKEIIRRKFKNDRFFRWLSRGEFSTANLVRAFTR